MKPCSRSITHNPLLLLLSRKLATWEIRAVVREGIRHRPDLFGMDICGAGFDFNGWMKGCREEH